MNELVDGVYEVPPELAGTLQSAGFKHTFLDRLILPGPLSTLSPDQVIAINRFRERERGPDQQFKKADRARHLMLGAITLLGTRTVLEVGMGKYPLSFDLALDDYFGIDIDPEALDFCHQSGVKAGGYAEVCGTFSLAVAVFSLHFSLTESQMKTLERALADDGVLISVVIDDESGGFADLMSKLSQSFSATRVLMSPNSNRERWVVCSKSSGLERLAAAYEYLSESLAKISALREK